jgi:ribonuclease HII
MARCNIRSDNGRAARATAGLYAFDSGVQRDRGVRIVGVDEAGRGPLAGPVVAGAVILDLDKPIPGINDSKKLTARMRDELYGIITAHAAWAVGLATPAEIDRLNILAASLLAMRRALDGLGKDAFGGGRRWSLALIDGNVSVPGLAAHEQQTVVRGDGTSASVAAASIVAKVTRDRIMNDYHGLYPGYEFALHKGYATSLHRERVRRLGMCAIHRRTFCEAIVTQTSLFLEPGEPEKEAS